MSTKAGPIAMRPHHLLDIVTNFKPDTDPGYVRARGEHGVRDITRLMGTTLDFLMRLVVGPDAICEPCADLQPDGRCKRILTHHTPPVAMDDYNNPLDTRLLACLRIPEGTVMTARDFLRTVQGRLDAVVAAFRYEPDRAASRRAGLIAGLTTLGIRPTE